VLSTPIPFFIIFFWVVYALLQALFEDQLCTFLRVQIGRLRRVEDNRNSVCFLEVIGNVILAFCAM
jgi:hypothetical protein